MVADGIIHPPAQGRQGLSPFSCLFGSQPGCFFAPLLTAHAIKDTKAGLSAECFLLRFGETSVLLVQDFAAEVKIIFIVASNRSNLTANRCFDLIFHRSHLVSRSDLCDHRQDHGVALGRLEQISGKIRLDRSLERAPVTGAVASAAVNGMRGNDPQFFH